VVEAAGRVVFAGEELRDLELLRLELHAAYVANSIHWGNCREHGCADFYSRVLLDLSDAASDDGDGREGLPYPSGKPIRDDTKRQTRRGIPTLARGIAVVLAAPAVKYSGANEEGNDDNECRASRKTAEIQRHFSVQVHSTRDDGQLWAHA
jgi:hypothetical protein